MSNWKEAPTKPAQKHWIDLIYQSANEEGEGHWYAAAVKWDGCIHLHAANNVPFCEEYGLAGEKRDKHACDDYTHICDLEDYIRKLLQLRRAAIKHFGKEWAKQ